jgi:transposase-like protein
MNELKNRGLGDILIAVIDGLKGFPEAITAVYPETQIQTCVVHLIRNSLRETAYASGQRAEENLHRRDGGKGDEGAGGV